MATFTNQATLSYRNATVASNIVTGEILEVLSVTKNAVDTSYRPGDTITYVIGVTNTGETAVTGLTLTDDLGAYTPAGGTEVVPLDYVPGTLQLYADGVLQPTPVITAQDPLTVTGLTVQDNGSLLLIYQAQVNEYAPLGVSAAIENTVTVSGAQLTEPVTATAVVDADLEPVLSISKALSPVAVNENGRVTYTFVLENRGATEASGDVVISDTFDPILSDLAVTYNGAAWAQGTNYSYAQATGLFTSLAGQITIPAATMLQDPTTGAWTVNPGTATLVVSGTI